jgi:hypothetical protein
MKIKHFCFLVVLAAIFSCNAIEKDKLNPSQNDSKQIITTNDEANESTTEGITIIWESPELRNDFLVFENWSHASWYMSKVAQMESLERASYEQSLDFISMQTVYDEFEEWSRNSVETGYGVPFNELQNQYQGTLIFDRESDPPPVSIDEGDLLGFEAHVVC